MGASIYHGRADIYIDGESVEEVCLRAQGVFRYDVTVSPKSSNSENDYMHTVEIKALGPCGGGTCSAGVMVVDNPIIRNQGVIQTGEATIDAQQYSSDNPLQLVESVSLPSTVQNFLPTNP